MPEPVKPVSPAPLAKTEPVKPAPVSGAKRDDLNASVSASLKNPPLPQADAIAAAAARRAGEKAAEADKPKRAYKQRASKPKDGYVAPGTGPDAQKEAYRKAGRQCADTIILMGRTLGGTDWDPKQVKNDKGEIVYDEQHTLREAWADMAEEYEWSKMPGWAAASIATGMYIVPRLAMPSTLSRIDKLKLWWASRKAGNRERERVAKANAAEKKDGDHGA